MIRHSTLRKGAADDFQGSFVIADRKSLCPHGGGVTDSAHSNRFQVLSLGKHAQPDDLAGMTTISDAQPAGLAGMTTISEAQPNGLAGVSATPTACQTVWLGALTTLGATPKGF